MPNHRNLVIPLICVLLGMILLTAASVPIYELFCKMTGFGGTTMKDPGTLRYHQTPGVTPLVVEFDANTHQDLPWKFIPKQRRVSLVPGQNVMVFYEAENLSDKDIIGTSVYNVTPHKVGQYFVKIQCFCFEEQLLKAGQKMLMPVSFFIDPEFENDPEVADVDTITLSYSFFKVKEMETHK